MTFALGANRGGILGRCQGVERTRIAAYRAGIDQITTLSGVDRERVTFHSLDDMETATPNFEARWIHEQERLRELWQQGDPAVREAHETTVAAQRTSVPSRDYDPAVLADVYDLEKTESALRYPRDYIDKVAHRQFFAYRALLALRDATGYLHELRPFALKLTVSPKPENLAVVPVNTWSRILQQRLDQRVSVDDDIHAMTVAEAALGGGAPGPLAMLNLATGIGVGFHDGERVLRGRYAAGLISEQCLYVGDLAQVRSLDRTICGRGLREMYRERAGNEADAVTIFARARAREVDAEAVVGVFARQLGLVMQMISRFYHPARIVINGSIRHAADVFLDRAVETYRAGLEPAFRAEVGLSTLDHAAELGALLGASPAGS